MYSHLLERAMARKSISQYALAEASGIPQPTIQRILSGETKDPKVSTLAKLAPVLECDVGALIVPRADSQVAECPARYSGRKLTREEEIVLDLFGGLTDSQRREKIRELEADKSHNDALLQELVKRRPRSKGAA